MDLSESTINIPFQYFENLFLDNGYSNLLNKFHSEYSDLPYAKYNKNNFTYEYKNVSFGEDGENETWYDVKASFIEDTLLPICRVEFKKSKLLLQEKIGSLITDFSHVNLFLNRQLVVLNKIKNNLNPEVYGYDEYKKIIQVLINHVESELVDETKNTSVLGETLNVVNKPKKAPPVPINKIKYKKLKKINQFVSAIKEKPGLFDSVNKQNLINVFSGAAPASKIKWELKSKGNGSVTLIYFLFSLIKHELIDKLDSGELSDSIVLCFKDSNGNDFLKRRLEEPKIAAQAHLDGERKSKSKEINKINELLEKLEKIKKLH